MKFSVIIPVFNSEKFIERCLESLQAQTYGDWEAICVDDGSTDSSAEMLDRISAQDNRIKVMHTANEGVSVARNVAMREVEGDYVTYLDSDDFLHPQTFEICNKIIKEENPDIIAYTYDRKYRRNELIKNMVHLPGSRKKKYAKYDVDNLEYKVTDDIYKYATEYSRPNLPNEDRKWAVKHCQPWRCMYRKGLVARLKFIRGIIYEDMPWWGEVLLNVKKAVILNLPLYFYYPNPWGHILSADQSYRIKSLEKAIAASEDFYRRLGNDYQKEKWNQNFLIPFKKKLQSKQTDFGSGK